MDISVGEAYRGQGLLTDALMPIPEQPHVLIESFPDGMESSDCTIADNQMRTRDSSNCFYKKSPKGAEGSSSDQRNFLVGQ